MSTQKNHPASFRDPSGYIFTQDGRIHRHITPAYRPIYQQFQKSLQPLLLKKNQIVHEEIIEDTPEALIVRPTQIPFISYPYEWCFSQLKDAATLTLALQKTALAKGMILKDASAYNIQFHNGAPILIDTLSFDTYQDGQFWDGYRQFCQHFLAPLALMAHTDLRLNQLLRSYIDGIPLDLTKSLLPSKTRFSPRLSPHIHLQASVQNRTTEAQQATQKQRKLPKNQLLGIVDALISAVNSLKLAKSDTPWEAYYTETNYSQSAMSQKETIVSDLIDQASPAHVWDLGANNGKFSRLASDKGTPTIAFDIDHGAVEYNYQQAKQNKETHILPLLSDLTNPSPAIGWANQERDTLAARRQPNTLLLALALVHHLAIGNNVPLGRIAAYFATLGDQLLIEFVPKEDSQAQRLLANRKDIFPTYTQSGFETAFSDTFTIKATHPIPDTHRTLYLMQAR